MKNLIASTALMFVAAFSPFLLVGTEEEKKLEELPTTFAVKRSVFKYNFEISFKSGSRTLAKGRVLRLYDNKRNFILVDHKAQTQTVTGLYTIYPHKAPLFVISDANDCIKGFVEVKNTSFSKLFHPIGLICYSAEGKPLLRGEYPLFHPSYFNLYNLETKSPKPVLKGGTLFTNYKVTIQEPLSTDPITTLAFLQLLVNKSVLRKPRAFLDHQGVIHRNDLSRFKEVFQTKSVTLLEKTPDQEENECLLWKKLKNHLEDEVVRVSLSENQKEWLIDSLADRFENEEGEVDVNDCVNALDDLTNEEKLILLDLIAEKEAEEE